MSFLKKHYEKIILTVLLIIFVVSLVWLILIFMKGQDVTLASLKIVPKPPDVTRIDLAKFNIVGELSVRDQWEPIKARSKEDPVFTDLLDPFNAARCASVKGGGCRKIIPQAFFKKGEKCPLCGVPLDDPDKPPELDTDKDGMPDSYERANSLDPNDPKDADLDADNDNYSNLEECRAATNPRDPASHPPDVMSYYLEKIVRQNLNMSVTKVESLGDDKSKWTVHINIGQKTRFMNINGIFEVDGEKYKIIDIIPKTEERITKGLSVMTDVSQVIIARVDSPDDKIVAVVKETVKESGAKAFLRGRDGKEYKLGLKSRLVIGDDTRGKEEFELDRIVEDSGKQQVILKSLKDGKTYVIEPKIGGAPGPSKSDAPPMPPGMIPEAPLGLQFPK